jgi:tetratricopeptide (TPR) repeat protein
MQGVIAALLLLGAGTDPLDREALRRSIELPSISMTSGMAMNGAGQIILPDRNVSLPAEIAAAEKTLRETGEDPRCYRVLSDLYFRAGDKERGKAARVKALNLYRAQLVGRTRDGLLLAHYADCLDWTTQRDEVERLLREAVRLAPAEWECWVLLAGIPGNKADDLLFGKESERGSNPFAALERRAREGQITPEVARQAQDYFAEALRYHDRAVALAPRESAVYLARAGLRSSNRMVLGFIHKFATGKDLDPASFSAILTDCCADLWRAAYLKPDDFAIVGIAAFYEQLASLPLRQEKRKDRQPASEKSTAAVQWATAQLEKLAAGADPHAAARAAEVLCFIYLTSGNSAKAQESATRAVRLNPDLDEGWDLRMGPLWPDKGDPQVRIVWPEKMAGLLAVSRERLQHRDSARNRFLLAKVCEAVNRPAEAMQILEVALKHEPDNFLCNLGLAALLMKCDDRMLERAGRLLDRAEQSLRKQPTEENVILYGVLRLTFLALNGQADQARAQLLQLCPERRADSRMQALSKILEPAVIVPAGQFRPAMLRY